MNMFNKLAEELKAIRIEKGISLDQVAAITRNNPKLLEAMEEGDFSFSDDIIVKAYYKEYVKAIGLDLPLYLQKFEAAKQGKDFDVPKKEAPKNEPPIVEQPKEEIKNEEPVKPIITPKKVEKNFVEKDDQESLFSQHEETKREPTQKRVISSTPPSRTSFNAVTNDVADYSSSKSNTGLIIATVAAGVILLAAVAYFYFIKDNSAEIVHETPYEEVQSESENRFEETDSVTPLEQTEQVSTDSINLVITAREQSWFEITIDSANSTQMTLNANEERSFKGIKNFRLNTGNAQALSFMLNGQSLPYSTTRRAAKLFIDSAGVKELKTPKKVKTVNEQPGI